MELRLIALAAVICAPGCVPRSSRAPTSASVSVPATPPMNGQTEREARDNCKEQGGGIRIISAKAPRELMCRVGSRKSFEVELGPKSRRILRVRSFSYGMSAKFLANGLEGSNGLPTRIEGNDTYRCWYWDGDTKKPSLSVCGNSKNSIVEHAFPDGFDEVLLNSAQAQPTGDGPPPPEKVWALPLTPNLGNSHETAEALCETQGGLLVPDNGELDCIVSGELVFTVEVGPSGLLRVDSYYLGSKLFDLVRGYRDSLGDEHHAEKVNGMPCLVWVQPTRQMQVCRYESSPVRSGVRVRLSGEPKPE